MGLVKYTPDRRGIQQLLGSMGVLEHLTSRAVRVQSVAQAEYAAHPPHSGEVRVVVDPGIEPRTGRARVAVIAEHPGALPIEADRRPLGKAMDAAG